MPPIRCDPRGATLDVHYPDPFGSDTFCRELVERSAKEADPSERFRALVELALAFQPAAGLLSQPEQLRGAGLTLHREEEHDSQHQGAFHPRGALPERS